MAKFIVFKKMELHEAVQNMISVEEWFEAHPTRRVCQTDIFKIHRGHVVRDFLKRTKDMPWNINS